VYQKKTPVNMQGGDGDAPDNDRRYKWSVTKRRGSPIDANDIKRMQVTTENRFQVLSDEDEGEIEDVQDISDPTIGNLQEAKSELPKPVDMVFPPLDNINEFLREINHVIGGESFTYTTQRNGQIRIKCKSVDVYRELNRYCTAKNIERFTYQLKHDRAFRCVIEGLHNSTDKNYIKSELAKYGHEVRNIITARHRIGKFPLDLFFVDLEPHTDNKDVYNVIYIGNAKVKIVPPRNTPHLTPQCHRCQEEGHTKTYCNMPWVCVKCAGNHPTDKCTKKKEEPAKCYFCSGPHPSNYRGCEHFQRRRTQTKTSGPTTQPGFMFRQEDFPRMKNAGANQHQTSYGPSYANPGHVSSDDRITQMLVRMEQLMRDQMQMVNNLITLVTSLVANKNK